MNVINTISCFLIYLNLQKVLCRHFSNIDINFVKDNKTFLLALADQINHETEVTDIWIEGQNISELKQGTFSNLLKLKTIKIQNTQLQEIDKKAFVNLPSLRVLNLNGNQVKVVKGIFKSLHITKLYLAVNSIASLDEDAFHDVQYLEVLDLSHNYITELHPCMFKGTKNLGRINLSFNKLSAIPQDCFQDAYTNVMVEQDSYLDLSDNHLTYINLKSLQGIHNIKKICLQNNELEQLSPNTFDDIDYIEEVNLGNNQLRYLNDRILGKLKSAKIVDLFGNPWNVSFVKKITLWYKKNHKNNTIIN